MTQQQSPEQELQILRAELAAQQRETERLRNELALHDRALDAAPSHFMISQYVNEQDSRVVYVNRAMAESHGYRRDEMLGMSVKALAPLDWTPARYQQLRTAIKERKEVHAEGLAPRKDGSTFAAGFLLVPIYNEEGRLTHTMSIGSDITKKLEEERKKRELQDQLYREMKERERILLELRLAQKLEAVGRLAAGVAHEINTPIQYVGDSLYFLRSAFDDLKGLLDRCRDAVQTLATADPEHAVVKTFEQACTAADLEFLQAEIPKAFERTFEGAQRVTHIVRAMKEFSHPDAGDFSSADINHALQTTLTVATNEYKYLAAVKTQFAELPPVICNIGELNQVFLNLIVNAAHAIQDAGKDVGSGEIFIGTAVSGDAVEITIGDNGCGIPAEHLEKIYDPFFTTKEVGRGTGQGLAIAHSIVVEKCGGDIRVDSKLGVGTQFVLRLPIAGRPAKAATV